MANIKSAIKRNKQNEKRRVMNRIYRGRARTYVQRARLELQGGSEETTEEAIRAAVSALDIAAGKGVIHPNNAARRKSRLMKQLAKQSK